MKVLVTGANGFLGTKIVKIFSDRGAHVIATDRIQKNNLIALDITDKEKTLRVIEEYKPDAVIHTAAITAVDWCETHKDETFEVNVEGTRNVALACKKTGLKMVLISTDYVFDGTKKEPYTEEDEPNPVNVYSESKLEAEKIVRKELEDYLIGRVTVLYGFNGLNDKMCFPMQVIDTLKQNKEFFCFDEQFSNPTLINDIANAVFLLLEKNQSGLFHMTGRENINRIDFAKEIAKIFNLDESLLKGASWKKVGFKAKRAPNLNISVAKLEKAGIKMSGTKEGILKMKEDMEKL